MLQNQSRTAGAIAQRDLGKTGLKVSIIGVGGGHLCRPHVEEATSIRIVQTAIDEGVNFLDNCWEYWQGESERRMGLALEGRRDKAVIMTKVCGRDRKTAEENLNDSLRRFKTDVIDVWQFHEINYDNDPDWIFAPGGAIEAAEAARKTGKVRFIGFTGHKSPDILLRMLEQGFDWDTCQLPINVMDYHYRSFQQQVLPELNKRNIAALGMKSLGGDAQMIKSAGLTAEQCRRYALSLPISTLICGMESLENLHQDLEIARNFEAMSESELEALRDRVCQQATDGRHEWFKSTQYYDAQTHRDQHGFPPIGHVSVRS